MDKPDTTKRKILKIIPAAREDIGALQTRRALPSKFLEHIDPFLFLNHHGPQTYPPNNSGLPFAPHPHRGFQTVTFILKGDVAHKDSAGHESVIKAGGVQWMSAGSGLEHEEVSSAKFKKSGGELEILQLWVNLPSKLKMSKPYYVGLQKEHIPAIDIVNGNGKVHLLSGQWETCSGAFKPLIDLFLSSIELNSETKLNLETSSNRNVFFYLVKGQLEVNSQAVKPFHLIHFGQTGELIEVKAKEDSLFLFGHAPPFNEPIASYGPFVMNTRAEIVQAIQDYQQGKFQ
ncbi:MAG: pirin family protein [Bacteriovoracaceae bacterium]